MKSGLFPKNPMHLNPTSLAKTVDSVNEAFFFKQPITSAEREAVALWIAKRQGLEGSYADMFAPTAADMKNGMKLFTGEMLKPSASLRHVIGEEAARALVLLKPKSKEARLALDRATEGMLARLANEPRAKSGKGAYMFCCGTCDPSIWRHISAGGLKGAEKWIEYGMKSLQAHRDGKGMWRRYPFFWVLLALIDIDTTAAKQEIKYAAKKAEKYLVRSNRTNSIVIRRRTVIERVLNKI